MTSPPVYTPYFHTADGKSTRNWHVEILKTESLVFSLEMNSVLALALFGFQSDLCITNLSLWILPCS